MRVGFARDEVCSGSFRRAASRESRDRKIKASPEKVYRAAFSNEARSELLEYPVRLNQDAPKPIGVLSIVGCVFVILGKTNRLGDFIWFGVNLNFYAQRPQSVRQLAVEVGNRTGLQSKGPADAVASANE